MQKIRKCIRGTIFRLRAGSCLLVHAGGMLRVSTSVLLVTCSELECLVRTLLLSLWNFMNFMLYRLKWGREVLRKANGSFVSVCTYTILFS